jgi:hypothetical protein
VLKNLTKIFGLTDDKNVLAAIERGYAYYETALFDRDGLPKPFSVGGDRSLRYSLYDFAEAVNLGILLRSHVPRAFERSIFIAEKIVGRFQLPDGHFVTSEDRFGMRNKTPFIRWPQAQLFHSLASLLAVLN